jgi:hypothetical protein
MRPKGFSGAGASAALTLLDDVTTSPASRRLAYTPAALETRPVVLLPRAASPHFSMFYHILQESVFGTAKEIPNRSNGTLNLSPGCI